MSDLILFKLGPTPADPVDWAIFADGAKSESGRAANVGALSELSGRFEDGMRIVAVLQGEQAAMREMSSAPRQSPKLLAAAGLLLEDDLAQPVADMHIVVSAGEPRAAIAISKAALEDWLAAFDAAGAPVNEFCVDFTAVGGSASTVVFVADGDRVIASAGARGFSAEADLVRDAAPSLLEAATDGSVIIYGAADIGEAAGARMIDRRALNQSTDILSIFAAALSSKPAPANLLTGAYRRHAPSSFRFQPFKRPAMLAAGLAVASLLSVVAAGVRDARTAAAYNQSATAMHQAAFPGFSGGDIRAHARQLMSNGGATASFLEMSERLTAGLAADEGVAIDRIRYDGARGQYVFSIRSVSDSGIEALRAALDANGVIATDNGGYRRSGDAWVGEMTAKAK